MNHNHSTYFLIGTIHIHWVDISLHLQYSDNQSHIFHYNSLIMILRNYAWF